MSRWRPAGGSSHRVETGNTHTHTLLDSLVVLVYMTCAKHQARAHAEQRSGYCSFTMADVQCHGVSVS